jgi:creatinine amidohydrolase
LDGKPPLARLPGIAQYDHQKPMADPNRMQTFGPEGIREIIGDGNFGDSYQRSDENMDAVWQIAIAETRADRDQVMNENTI